MNSLECCTEIVGKNCVSYSVKCLELASERTGVVLTFFMVMSVIFGAIVLLLWMHEGLKKMRGTNGI